MHMRIAIVQLNPSFGAVQANIETAVGLMETVRADLYVLPELCNTGYNFISKAEVQSLAEPGDTGPTAVTLKKFAKQNGCYVVYGFAEDDKGTLYNSAALIGPSGTVGFYRKIHLYDRENIFFEPGNLGFLVFDTPYGKIGIMVCFDWMFPESARTLAIKGAHLIAHPSNLVMPYCPDAMVTRCLENRVFAATADRIGVEDRGGIRLTYIGKSEVVSPRGEILVRLSDDREEIAFVDVDLSLARTKRINAYNDVLSDRQQRYYAS
jgi:predicted amidohydrolase